MNKYFPNILFFLLFATFGISTAAAQPAKKVLTVVYALHNNQFKQELLKSATEHYPNFLEMTQADTIKEVFVEAKNFKEEMIKNRTAFKISFTWKRDVIGGRPTVCVQYPPGECYWIWGLNIEYYTPSGTQTYFLRQKFQNFKWTNFDASKNLANYNYDSIRQVIYYNWQVDKVIKKVQSHLQKKNSNNEQIIFSKTGRKKPEEYAKWQNSLKKGDVILYSKSRNEDFLLVDHHTGLVLGEFSAQITPLPTLPISITK